MRVRKADDSKDLHFFSPNHEMGCPILKLGAQQRALGWDRTAAYSPRLRPPERSPVAGSIPENCVTGAQRMPSLLPSIEIHRKPPSGQPTLRD
jgi:hypothetical protein